MNDLLKLKIEKLPTCPGCYLMKCEGRIIYVGKAVNLKNRVSQYFTIPRRIRSKYALWLRESMILISCCATQIWKP